MKKSLMFVMVFSTLLFTASTACAQSGKLPAPQITGGVPTLEAIENRASPASAQFPTGEISRQELSTLLWAAGGRNRGGSGWTVPKYF